MGKYQAFRKENKIENCQICGKDLKRSRHHMLCNTCWDMKKVGTIYFNLDRKD